MQEWKKRLATEEAAEVTAHDLYAGDHWSATLRAFRDVLRWSQSSELWVVSAGYGLIPATAGIKPYGATLSSGQEDSVWRGATDGNRSRALGAWWSALPHRSSLGEILTARDSPIVLLTAGAAYIGTLAPELIDIERNGSTDHLFVITTHRRIQQALQVDSRLSRAVGGSLSSLNARTTEVLCRTASEHNFQRPLMEATLRRLGDTLPPRQVRPQRRVVTDEQIAESIERIRVETPAVTRTSALQLLRARNIACEQARFAAIWGATERAKLT